MADQEEPTTTTTTEETPAPAPTEGQGEAPAPEPDAEKPPSPVEAEPETQQAEGGGDAQEEKQPEPAETVEGADEQKAPEPEGEPADQNANAVDGQQEEATEGQEKQEAETEQTEQAKEGEEGEGEGKEEEPKQEEGEAVETEEKKEEGQGQGQGEGQGEGEATTEGEVQKAEVEGEEGEKQEEGEGEQKEEEGEQKEGEGEEKEEEPKAEGEEGEEVPKSPVPQSDTFDKGERTESPVGVGQKLTPPGSPQGDVQIPVPDILEPGTPERSRPGSAEGDGEDKHLEPFEEEEEEEDDDEDEQPEFDREDLIDRYHQAISEREQLQQQNYQLQHKLADYFRKKKADESKQEYDKNFTDQEQRYLKYMAQLEDLRRQDMQERDNYKHQIEELKSRCEDRKYKVDEERQKFMEFKKQVAQNSLNSRSGRPIAPKDIETYLAGENRKESEVVNVRLENIKLKNKLKKKEHQLKSKEELAEGLHLIDFEQLKIENQTYNEKIEERNEELLKLRKKITSTVQVLTHLKEKLQYVQAENQVQKRNLREVESEVAQKRDILSRTKQARDALRIDNTRLRQNSGLLGNEPLLRDFEDRKDEGDDLRTKLERLKMQHAELTLHCNQVRRKIEQARNGRA